MYKLLDVEFDSWNGEAFYSDKMGEVVDILKQKKIYYNLLKEQW